MKDPFELAAQAIERFPFAIDLRQPRLEEFPGVAAWAQALFTYVEKFADRVEPQSQALTALDEQQTFQRVLVEQAVSRPAASGRA